MNLLPELGAKPLPKKSAWNLPNPEEVFTEQKSKERLHEATEAGQMAMSGMNVLNTGKSLAPLAAKGMEYLSPHKDISKVMEKFGGGAKTSEENISNLSSELSHGRIAQEEEALVPKREFLSETKSKNIYEEGKTELPNLNKITKLFGNKRLSDLSQNSLDSISNSLKEYYKKGGDTKKLVSKLEEILGHHLNEKSFQQLENLLPVGKLRSSKYLSNPNVTKKYNEGLKELHENFISNKNTYNTDKLMSAMKNELRRLGNKEEISGLTISETNLKNRLNKNLTNLISDWDKFVAELPKNQQGKYKDFTTKWRENASVYGEESVIKKLSHGEFQGITKNEIANTFSNPTKETIKILSDIGEKGRGHVLYNLLQTINPKDVKKFANAILDAKKTKGYQQYVTSDLEKFAHQLLRRQSFRERGADIALGIGTSLTPLGPWGGVAAVAGKHLYPHISHGLRKILGK